MRDGGTRCLGRGHRNGSRGRIGISQIMFLSVFDVFKIGIGPSSSHTMGPMSAANRFLNLILSDNWSRPPGASVAALKVSLHGSLAFTGLGHGTARAVILGL